MLYVICGIIAGLVIALDQVSKYFAETSNVNEVIIPELLKFKLAWNDGAAFSMLGDASWAQTFFKIMTIIILLGIIFLMVYCIVKKKNVSKWLAVAVAAVSAMMMPAKRMFVK